MLTGDLKKSFWTPEKDIVEASGEFEGRSVCLSSLQSELMPDDGSLGLSNSKEGSCRWRALAPLEIEVVYIAILEPDHSHGLRPNMGAA